MRVRPLAEKREKRCVRVVLTDYHGRRCGRVEQWRGLKLRLRLSSCSRTVSRRAGRGGGEAVETRYGRVEMQARTAYMQVREPMRATRW
jgi:hypothetical protein